MFFVLSKVLGFFANPSNLVIGCGLLGSVLLATRFARGGRRLMVGSLMTLAIMGFSPLGNVLMVLLEERFPRWDAARGAPDGIVVLGGAIKPDISSARNEVVLTEAGARITAAVALARRYPNARIIYSGGSGALIYREGNEAESAVQIFESLGIPHSRLMVEEQSRNTVENAAFSLLVAMPQPGERWLLVTSAYHMPRAIGTFRAAGFAVEAYPCDWRTRGTVDLTRPFFALDEGLERTDIAAREWVGLLVYWLTGRSSALLPRPLDHG
jgi:uncharacterized SAM-binding protein YcdF (DUF218 family)